MPHAPKKGMLPVGFQALGDEAGRTSRCAANEVSIQLSIVFFAERSVRRTFSLLDVKRSRSRSAVFTRAKRARGAVRAFDERLK